LQVEELMAAFTPGKPLLFQAQVNARSQADIEAHAAAAADAASAVIDVEADDVTADAETVAEAQLDSSKGAAVVDAILADVAAASGSSGDDFYSSWQSPMKRR
jgi:uncharacterized protein YbbK (DUF523 family)